MVIQKFNINDEKFKKLIEKIKILFKKKKDLIKKKDMFKSKILICKQINEEVKRQNYENIISYSIKLNEIEEFFETKSGYLKQYLKKIKEIEIYVNREFLPKKTNNVNFSFNIGRFLNENYIYNYYLFSGKLTIKQLNDNKKIYSNNILLRRINFLIAKKIIFLEKLKFFQTFLFRYSNKSYMLTNYCCQVNKKDNSIKKYLFNNNLKEEDKKTIEFELNSDYFSKRNTLINNLEISIININEEKDYDNFLNSYYK